MSVVSANGSAVALSPNYIINGAMDFWQRGSNGSSATYGVYAGPDRFVYSSNGGTSTQAQQSFVPGSAPIAGYDASYFSRYTIASGVNWSDIGQKIEDVRTLAGQTVTFSFYAKSSTSSSLAPIFYQNFGSGGSSQAESPGQSITLTTSWVRYSQTFVLPSVAGKTIGANSFLGAYLRTGTTSGSVFDVWGFQVELGSIATPFRRNANSLQGELDACQRYYQQLNSPMLRGVIGQSGTVANRLGTSLPVYMRVAPSIALTGTMNCYDGLNTTTFTGLTATYAMPGWIEIDSQGFTGGAALGAYRPALVYMWSNGSLMLSAEL